jgi:hypothetical protein
MPVLGDDEDDIMARVLTRAAVDAAFRQRLLSDPHGAIAEATGVVVPPAIRIRCIEQPRDVDALIVLPNQVDDAGVTS